MTTMTKGFVQRTVAELQVWSAMKERARCAEVAQRYPIDLFSYAGDTGELCRLRDTIAEAIAKGLSPGEAIS